MTAKRALWTIIGIATVVRLAWAASLGGFGNEAYHYAYAQHLDWGYFDHPPMVALVSAAGLEAAGRFSAVFGLRLGFVVMFAGSCWLLARLTTRAFGPRAAVMAVVAMNATMYYGVRIGTLVEPDGPLLFFWLLTLDRLLVALEAPERTSAWLLVGLAWGGGMLSKYHAVLLPAGALLYLVLRPSARRCLRMPGPYLAAIVGLAVFSPVIVWNARHGWISFLYQGTRAGGFHGLQPNMLLEALVALLFYLTPWVFAWMAAILAQLARRGPRQWSDAEAFLTCQAVPALALFLGVATFRRIMPHWPLIGCVALLPLLGRAWAERLATQPRLFRPRLAAILAVPVVVGSLFVLQARTGLFQDGRGRLFGLFAPAVDPTVDTIRWDQIARELEHRGLLHASSTFLFTDNWRSSAGLQMATGDAAPVACFHRDARSYTYWSQHKDWVGRDGIYVRVDDSVTSATDYAPWFTKIERIGSFPILRAGVPMETVRVYRCVQQTDPFPFGFRGRGRIPLPAKRSAPDDLPATVARGATTAPRALR